MSYDMKSALCGLVEGKEMHLEDKYVDLKYELDKVAKESGRVERERNYNQNYSKK